MAIGYLNSPGSPHGPCLNGCEHRDCQATRDMAAAPCGFCGTEIGYATGFFRADERTPRSDWVHATCAME
jgi:hypothetical protein